MLLIDFYNVMHDTIQFSTHVDGSDECSQFADRVRQDLRIHRDQTEFPMQRAAFYPGSPQGIRGTGVSHSAKSFGTHEKRSDPRMLTKSGLSRNFRAGQG